MSIEQEEKKYIHSYLVNRSINYKESSFICEYFSDFVPQDIVDIHDLKNLEQALELMIPGEDRKLNGAFFTPTSVVKNIISELNPLQNETCIDFACGCGAFLIELVEYIYDKSGKDINLILSENIFGCDILDYNVRRTKVLLAVYALENGVVITEADLNITNANSLEENWNDFDVIVGNPPYVKYQDLDDKNRLSLSKEFTTTIKGTFNLYFAFFEMGFNNLSEQGRLGFITPNNYFTSLSAEPLRVFFQREACVYKIIDFSHKKVFDAQTYTAITFIDRRENRQISYSKINDNQEVDSFLESATFSKNLVSNLSSKKWRLLRTDEQKNIQIIENSGLRLDELFDVNVGIATLKDHLYFLDALNRKDDFYVKIIDGHKFLIEPEVVKEVYKISDFKCIDAIEGNSRMIIFPYRNDAHNKLQPILENEFKKIYPKCYKYFQFIKDELKKREKKNIIIPFYAYGRSQGLNNRGPKLLTPTFSRYPRFMMVPNGNSLFCNGYAVSKRSKNSGLLFSDHSALAKIENLDVVQKIMNSYVMHYYISTTSVSIQGGYPCYQKNFMVRFTLPNFTDEEISKIRNIKDPMKLDECLISKYGMKIPTQTYDDFASKKYGYTLA
jgi:tRNA1(Val) A37 N6-methylase TrmN6